MLSGREVAHWGLNVEWHGSLRIAVPASYAAIAARPRGDVAEDLAFTAGQAVCLSVGLIGDAARWAVVGGYS